MEWLGQARKTQDKQGRSRTWGSEARDLSVGGNGINTAQEFLPLPERLSCLYMLLFPALLYLK